ncbi:hypothetical protein ES705_25602 [subsurface metagenome]
MKKRRDGCTRERRIFKLRTQFRGKGLKPYNYYLSIPTNIAEKFFKVGDFFECSLNENEKTLCYRLVEDN